MRGETVGETSGKMRSLRDGECTNVSVGPRVNCSGWMWVRICLRERERKNQKRDRKRQRKRERERERWRSVKRSESKVLGFG